MPATNYKITTVGPPVGKGVMQSVYVTLAGIAKKSDPGQPYVVANELICNQLARMLLLPCPPGAMMAHGGAPHFFSLDFNLAGHALPPADPSAIVKHDPVLSWGIILFDVLVMNADRHRENIAFDTTQKKVQIFDHSHAFLGTAGDIPARLASVGGQLAIGRHCLAAQIGTDDGKDLWIERIKQIPDFFIDGVIDAASKVGLPAPHVKDCKLHLKHRRDGLKALVEANIVSFPSLPRTVA